MDNLEPGALIVARYRLEEPLATELVGVRSWAATDQILDRPVQVSIIEGPDAALTLDAARRAALISDAHLTRVLDVLHDSGRDVVVTEPATGATLTDLLADGPLSAGAARAVIGDAAKALEAARRRGVHHGALRPSSIRVHNGTVRVNGLGIDGALTAHSSTPTGEEASREDAVALVALLHFALTGVLPRAGYSGAALDADLPAPAGLQRAGEPLAAPRDIVSDVPQDLDTLCAVTLGPHDDGPFTPGELVAELEPWDEDDVPLTAALPAALSTIEAPPTPSTGVNRQSVRAFGSAAAPSAGSTMPGTPPPAGPVRRQSTGRIPRVSTAGAAATGAAAAAVAGGAVAGGAAASTKAAASTGGAAMPPTFAPAGAPSAALAATSPVPAPPAASAAAPSATSAPRSPSATPRSTPSSGAPAPRPAAAPTSSGPSGLSTSERAKRFHFNPTPVVLVLMLGLLVVGGVAAKNTLFSGYSPAIVQPEGRPGAAATGEPAAPADGSDPVPEEPVTVPPVIAGGKQIALPGNTPGDHPELEGAAVDGDVITAWYSLTYNTPQFGGYTNGLGYLVTLEQPATVSSLFLATKNTGGNVEIRATDENDPTGGQLLASGPLSPETPFTFDPVETQSIVIWFTELPQATDDGGNRAHIYEINVS